MTRSKKTRLLDLVTRKGLILESQIVGQGLLKTLQALLVDGKVDLVPHPTVKRKGVPAAAVAPRKAAE